MKSRHNLRKSQIGSLENWQRPNLSQNLMLEIELIYLLLEVKVIYLSRKITILEIMQHLLKKMKGFIESKKAGERASTTCHKQYKLKRLIWAYNKILIFSIRRIVFLL
jgi:hypothetical protein